ncbi:peptidylprolyl isomerase [Cryobacterium adonitolivorans]|uniref:peptidylprolyl isomerase n=1 Tax=Cryobacterium adonitolivorans TaxID=1259189 RepID=A0A4R8W7T2_9MICO|nr:peptidylprolyl isomerase [Cryobacterium adonitolivorans]TFC04320.1 peptidylprolyl isomerase [Cryobacterium adonitolivorans]
MAPNTKQEREARGRARAYQARKAVNEHQVKRRVRDNIVAGSVLVVALVVLVGAQLFYFGGGPGTPEPSASGSATPEPTAATPAAGANSGAVPDSALAEGRTWTGTLTLNGIPLGVELDGAAAPQAVSSTISLAQSGFYDNLSCHRLTTGGFSVLQCGDPDGDGTGGPGYSYGPIENAPADNVYPAGTLAMARAGGDGYSTGSQFFLVYADTTIPADDAGGYTVIGSVTSGLDQVVNQIAAGGVADGSADGAPLIPTTISSFSVQ